MDVPSEINLVRPMRLFLCCLLIAACAAPLAAQTPTTAAPEAAVEGDAMAPYRDAASRIIAAALADSAAWHRLAELTDTFGPRFSGTQALEDALDWVLAEMKKDGLENVRGEPVMVPRWVRGEESAELVLPRPAKLAMLGLGGSIATPPEGIEADVLVVGSFDELEARKAEAAGKIVLFDVPFTNYGQTVQYRSLGAIRAAQAGAVASLIRSVASGSMYTPHTGGMRYEEGTPKIPHAALTVEDAAMLHRMQERGQKVRVRLKMSAQALPDAPSRNVVAEIRGREFPDEVIVMGGHSDSWDVGQGAMDDGGGCVAAWEALRILKSLGLRPRRTIRVVLWTNEENGLAGGRGYRNAHEAELDNHVLAIESDSGVFDPEGFGITGKHEAFAAVEPIGKLLEPIGAGAITRGGGGADISPLMRHGVPGMALQVDGTRYFHYHHTEADTMDKIDPRHLAQCVAAMAIMSYVVAEMPERLPRDFVVPEAAGQ